MLGYPEMAVNDVTLVKMWTRLYMRGQASEYKYQYSKAVTHGDPKKLDSLRFWRPL